MRLWWIEMPVKRENWLVVVENEGFRGGVLLLVWASFEKKMDNNKWENVVISIRLEK